MRRAAVLIASVALTACGMAGAQEPVLMAHCLDFRSESRPPAELCRVSTDGSTQNVGVQLATGRPLIVDDSNGRFTIVFGGLSAAIVSADVPSGVADIQFFEPGLEVFPAIPTVVRSP